MKVPYFHRIEVPFLQNLSALFGQCPLTFEVLPRPLPTMVWAWRFLVTMNCIICCRIQFRTAKFLQNVIDPILFHPKTLQLQNNTFYSFKAKGSVCCNVVDTLKGLSLACLSNIQNSKRVFSSLMARHPVLRSILGTVQLWLTWLHSSQHLPSLSWNHCPRLSFLNHRRHRDRSTGDLQVR